MMFFMLLSYLSLSSVRRHLHSGQDGFLPIHSVMHSSQNLCVQFIERHGLRNISIQIPHWNSSINLGPPSIMLSVVHFSPFSSPVAVSPVASADACGLLLSVLGLSLVASGLACRDARSVLCRPHPSLARSFASCLLPHPPPVCWYCCIKLPLLALPLPDPLRGSASCASFHPPPACCCCCAVS